MLAENVCLWVKPVPEGENEQRWISVLGDRRFSDGLREGLCKGMTRHYYVLVVYDQTEQVLCIAFTGVYRQNKQENKLVCW